MAGKSVWWAVSVGDMEGNTGTDIIVGPFRSEAEAYKTRERIDRHMQRGDVEPLTTVIQLVGWRQAIDELV